MDGLRLWKNSVVQLLIWVEIMKLSNSDDKQPPSRIKAQTLYGIKNYRKFSFSSDRKHRYGSMQDLS